MTSKGLVPPLLLLLVPPLLLLLVPPSRHRGCRHLSCCCCCADPCPFAPPSPLQSAIGYPAHNEVVPLAAGTYPVRGYAYCGEGPGGQVAAQHSTAQHTASRARGCRVARCSAPACSQPHRPIHATLLNCLTLPRCTPSFCPPGAGAKIIRCELSLDDGKTWRLAEQTHTTPPNAYGKHWAWVWWSIGVPICERHAGRGGLHACDSACDRAPAELAPPVLWRALVAPLLLCPAAELLSLKTALQCHLHTPPPPPPPPGVLTRTPLFSPRASLPRSRAAGLPRGHLPRMG